MRTGDRGDVDALCDALTRNATQLAAVLLQISDPTPKAIGIWSIGETANHVAASHEYFLAAARGEAVLESLDEVDAGNARGLAEDLERDPTVLADRLEAGTADLVGFAGTVEGDPAARPFTGVDVPLSTLLAIALGEVLVHGHDIARAARLPWTITRADALLAHRAFLPLYPYLLDRERSVGVRLTAEIRIRGMEPFVVSIRDRDLSVEEAFGQRVSFTLSVDPAVYLLMSFNRVNPLAEMLRGKLLLWGRRPWRIRTFQSLLAT